MYDRKKIRSEVMALQKEFAAAFHNAADMSRVEAMRTLKPGEPAPSNNKIYGDHNRNAFEAKAAALREKGHKIVNDARKEVGKAMSAAPSPEAINSVGMLKMRDKLTADEVTAIVDRYGDNYMTYQTIKDIAKKSGFYLDAHPLENAARDLEGADSTVSGWTLRGAETGVAANQAFIDFAEMLG